MRGRGGDRPLQKIRWGTEALLSPPQYLENVITNWRIKREWAREKGKMRGQMRHQWPWLSCKQQYTLVTSLLLSRLLMLTVTGFSMVSFNNNNNNNNLVYIAPVCQTDFSCLVSRNSEFLAVPPNFLIWGWQKKIFVPPKLWTRFTPLVHLLT